MCADGSELGPNGHLPGWDGGSGNGGAGGSAGQGGAGGSAAGGSGGTGANGGTSGNGGTAGNGGSSGSGGAGGNSSDAGADVSTGGSAANGGSAGTGGSSTSGGSAGTGGGGGTTPFDAGATLPKPLSYWPLEQIGGGAPDAVGDHHGHFNGSPTQKAGKVGNAVEFNVTGNVDQYVNVYPADDMRPLLTMAVSVWFKSAIPLNNNIAPFISRRDGFHLTYGYGKLYFDISDVSSTTSTAAFDTTFTANQWHHAAGSYDANGDNLLHLYLDGAEVATAPGTGSIYKVGIERTHLAYESVYVQTHYFLGSLDEAVYYAAPLSAADVTALYNAGNNGQAATSCASCPQPIAYWPLDTNPDLTVPDAVGTNPGSSTDGPPRVPGKVGDGVLLLHGTDRISVPNAVSLNPADAWTVAMWIRPSSDISPASPVYHEFLHKQAAYRLAGGYGPVLFNIAGEQASWGGTLWKDTWYHLAGTWDGASKEIKLYVDGAPVAQKTATGAAASSSYPVNISRDNASFGSADEIVIYDATLTDEQVAALYNYGAAGLPVPTN